MLSHEIERQAARNSTAMWEIVVYMLNERMTAKRWEVHDEVICQLLARHEAESHGASWPPVPLLEADEPKLEIKQDHEPVIPPAAPVVEEASPPPPPPDAPRSFKVKLKKRKRRK